ncbi:MAG: hypothetical protein KC615_24870, partial [Anaerolineae bacterium]|nr:hypothetical protein [Anaerolineae bacterium]
LPARAKKAKWTTFTPPAAALRRRHRGLILHRRSQAGEHQSLPVGPAKQAQAVRTIHVCR